MEEEIRGNKSRGEVRIGEEERRAELTMKVRVGEGTSEVV